MVKHQLYTTYAQAQGFLLMHAAHLHLTPVPRAPSIGRRWPHPMHTVVGLMPTPGLRRVIVWSVLRLIPTPSSLTDNVQFGP